MFAETMATGNESDASIEELDAEAEREDELDEELQSKAVQKRKKRTRLEKSDGPRLVSRFVNLVDILPPVPKKGDFDVKLIKNSLYFFS